MRMIMRSILAAFAFFTLVVTVISQEDVKITRERILEQNEKRKGQLNLMLFETRAKLSDHKAGRMLLDPEEEARLEKRAEMVERKIKKLEEVDEDEIQRSIRREQLRLERRRRPEQEL